MTVSIRPAVVADADRLGAVHVAAWQWAYRGLMPDDLLDSLRPEARARLWTTLLEDPSPSFSAWVVEVDGEIVGFASSDRAGEDDLPPGTIELLAIYLLEPHVGSGLGSRLIDTAEASWRDGGATLATLWVLEENTPTRAFYERHGWAADGATKVDVNDAYGTQVRYRKELA